jgi:magnesium chelatase subunit H
MRKPTSAVDCALPVRVVIVTMDNHLASATERARAALVKQVPGLSLVMHTAAEFAGDPEALRRCHDDIASGDIIINTMLFMQDHVQMVMPALEARRPNCDAMVGCMSAGEVSKLTRMGRLDMSAKESGAMAWLKKLRPKPKSGDDASSGARQMRMLRRLPKILRFVPGTAQDLRAYFLTLQYWLCGSEDNMVNMVRMLIDRYADGPRRALRGNLPHAMPVEYPEVGVYHPDLPGGIAETTDRLPRRGGRGTVGLLLMRSYPLAKNTGHYDGVVRAFEARGLDVVPAFAAGLDARPAIEKFFIRDGRPTVDAVVSLTGFSLVGGPAYNDAKAAEEILAKLDVPYIAAHPVEFQTLEQWAGSERGLMPVESTIMVAIPELDGSTGPMVYGGRSDCAGVACTGCHKACVFPASSSGRDMQSCAERAGMLASRVDKLVALRRAERANRKIAVVLFNFPPNAGNTGTAAHLSVFESLHRTLTAMRAEGYMVEMPESADALRERVVEGNAARYGALANVVACIPTDDHVRREPWLAQIEAAWGPAPGRQQSDGRSIHVLGERFGNVFVGVQPAFGYEGDPMRLLFEKGFAPTHAFSAFYRWLREDFGAHAVLHFGTHGALEFMPGKQAGLSGSCWPERLIGDLPNVYLYAANNPSEGAIAKRRAQATLVSYLTPPIAEAGLYRGLADLKASIDAWRNRAPGNDIGETQLVGIIQAQAAALELAMLEPAWGVDAETRIVKLNAAMVELEHALIPHGLHVVGVAPSVEERIDMLSAHADAALGQQLPRETLAAIAHGGSAATAAAQGGLVPEPAMVAMLEELARIDGLLKVDHEVPAILRALDGRYIRPAPGGDLIRTPAVLPTGRNVHGFDPFRIPSAFAVSDGARQAELLLGRYVADHGALPETVALVLWGTDNLKSEGAPIGQALALMGTRPRFDGYGRLTGAELIPLEQLGRPRIDVMLSLSGIFRDLLPLQIKLLAEASWLAASADEPTERNHVRKHALDYMHQHGCDLETAALRVYGNADGAYGANVNLLVDNGRWDDEDELAETYTQRKSFAFDRSGRPTQHKALLASTLAHVDLAYQNLESVELGITTVSNYFDTLGGISRAVKRAKGGDTPPVYISDQTKGTGTIRSLSEQVALESRTRVLNPKWYEGMLKHGYEGVRLIEEHVTNTMGWSATTGQVQPWVYQQLAQTFMLDPEMRQRLTALNPTASAKFANRLLEAQERQYWSPDEATLEALRNATHEVEDRLEGINMVAAA